MGDELIFDGTVYVSARRASDESGLSRDYIGRLCKKGSLVARRVGTAWYVDTRSLKGFLEAQKHVREYRREHLARERSDEYRSSSPKRKSAFVSSFGTLRTGYQVPDAPAEKPAKVREPEPVRVIPPARTHDLRGRLRRAFEKNDRIKANAAANLLQIPSGFTHAAFQNIPAQALSHVPVHAITPAMEAFHKLTALMMTVVIVLGVWSFGSPSHAKFTYDSVSGVASASTYGVRQAAAALSVSADGINHAVAVFGENSGSVLDVGRSSIASAYTALAVSVAGVSRFASLSSAGVGSTAVTLEISSASPEVSVPSAASSTQPAGDASTAIASAQTAAATVAAADTTSAGTTTALQASASIASAVPFTGSNVAYGDVVAYNSSTGVYSLSAVPNDPDVYGIVVQQPALLFDAGNGTVPVIRTGSALVNVTLENGPIRVGDPLTTSSIPGKARRANQGEHVIGTAAEPFTGKDGVLLQVQGGTGILSGTIAVDMDANSGAGPSSTDTCSTALCRLLSALNPDIVRLFARYLLAGLIAAISLTFSFKSFVSDVNYGVISVGRNPLAKKSIESMVLLNALLAVVIAGVGLFAAVFVLFATI